MGLALSMGVAEINAVDGNGSVDVVFNETFSRVPQIVLVERETDSGSYVVSLDAVSGFRVTVSSSEFGTGKIRVAWMAIQKI